MQSLEHRFGLWCASAAFAGGAGYSVAQLLQIAGWLRWPWDEILIYAFSFLIAWPFMLAMLALHRVTPQARKIWSGAGLLLAVIYATYVTLMYGVQLGTAIPLRFQGHANPLFAVDRYSLFWAIDALGYICMGFATLFAAQAFSGSPWVRRFFLANGGVTPIITLVYFYPVFSTGLLLLATPWIVTGPGSFLALALWFARQRNA